eukprot:1157331-Pelagomonas_calceolata.AAC.1
MDDEVPEQGIMQELMQSKACKSLLPKLELPWLNAAASSCTQNLMPPKLHLKSDWMPLPQAN